MAKFLPTTASAAQITAGEAAIDALVTDDGFAITAGTLLPIKVRRVRAENTSITADIVALY